MSDTAAPRFLQIPAPAAAIKALPELLDGAAVRRWLFQQLHGNRSACPHCQHEVDGRAANSFWQGRRVACKGCGVYFTAATGTALSKSKLSDEQMFLLLVSMALDLENKTTATMIGVNIVTVRENRQKIEIFQIEGGK